jgi:hypothetical protein
MVIIAMTLYLPQHIAFLTNRAWFYYNGPEKAGTVAQNVADGVKSVVENSGVSATIEMVKETVLSASAGGKTMLEGAKEL